MAGRKEIDFFAQVRADSGVNKIRNVKSVPIAWPFGVAVLLILACWCLFSLLNLNAGRRLSIIGTALGGSTGQVGTTAVNGRSGIEDILNVELEYNNEARLTSDSLKAIIALQPDDLEVRSVMYYDSSVIMECLSRRELCGADFAKLLRASPSFSDIGYTGVTAVDGGYSFSISFRLSDESAEVTG